MFKPPKCTLNLYIVSFPGSKRGSGYETDLYVVSFPGVEEGVWVRD